MSIIVPAAAELRQALRAAVPSEIPVAFDNTVPLDSSFAPVGAPPDRPIVELLFGSAGAGQPLGIGASAPWSLEGSARIAVGVPLDSGESAARQILEDAATALGPNDWSAGIRTGAASLSPGSRSDTRWLMAAEVPWEISYVGDVPEPRQLALGDSFVDIGTAIRDAFVNVLSPTLGFQIEVPNVERQGTANPAQPAADLFIVTGDREAVSSDGTRVEYEEVGYVQLQTFWPVATGSAAAHAAVDSTLDLVRGLRTGAVAFDAPFFQTIGLDGEQWRLDVFAPYTARTAEVH